MKCWYEILFSNYAEKYESENTWILKSLGHHSVEIFAARLGEFSLEHPLTTEDFEMLVVTGR